MFALLLLSFEDSEDTEYILPEWFYPFLNFVIRHRHLQFWFVCLTFSNPALLVRLLKFLMTRIL